MFQFKCFSFPDPSSFQTVPNNSFVWLEISSVLLPNDPIFHHVLFNFFLKMFFFITNNTLNTLFTNTQQTVLLPGGWGAACNIKDQSFTQKRQTQAKNDECSTEMEVWFSPRMHFVCLINLLWFRHFAQMHLDRGRQRERQREFWIFKRVSLCVTLFVLWWLHWIFFLVQ